MSVVTISNLHNATGSMINTVKYYSHDVWEEAIEHPTFDLPLLSSGPWHVVTIVGLWLYFVLSYGPRFMKNREPYDLRQAMLYHNGILVAVNGIGLLLAIPMTNFGEMLYSCRLVDTDNSASERVLFLSGYIYYISKLVDLMDTVYFVLRKKYTHITLLHVWHHALMPIASYTYAKYLPWTPIAFMPIVNSLIHTVMYGYFYLAALGPHMQKYLWWKKYLTQMQLMQFAAIAVYDLYFFMDPTCGCPKIALFFQALQAIFFFNLFFSFYLKSYKKSKLVDKEDASFLNDRNDNVEKLNGNAKCVKDD